MEHLAVKPEETNHGGDQHVGHQKEEAKSKVNIGLTFIRRTETPPKMKDNVALCLLCVDI